MRKIISKVIMIFAIALSFSAIADAQVYVKIRPPLPVVKVRPPAPSPAHIWVGGEWTWSRDNSRYDYRDGYWERPKYRNNRWVEGRWKQTRRGWIWVPGHWRRG